MLISWRCVLAVLIPAYRKDCKHSNNLSSLLWVLWSPESQFHDFVLYDSLPPSIYVNKLYVILMKQLSPAVGLPCFSVLQKACASRAFEGCLLSQKHQVSHESFGEAPLASFGKNGSCLPMAFFSRVGLSHGWLCGLDMGLPYDWVLACEMWTTEKKEDSFFPPSLHWSL